MGDAHSESRELRSQGRSMVVRMRHVKKDFNLTALERESRPSERTCALAVLGFPISALSS